MVWLFLLFIGFCAFVAFSGFSNEAIFAGVLLIFGGATLVGFIGMLLSHL
jgi:hypothetical protein